MADFRSCQPRPCANCKRRLGRNRCDSGDRFLGPETGVAAITERARPVLGFVFRASKWVASRKAIAFFRWANGARADVRKPVLVVNMDEASLRMHVATKVGTPLAGDRTGVAARRSACTLMASVSTDPTVNRRLPQLLVGNRRQFTKRLLALVRPELGKRLLL